MQKQTAPVTNRVPVRCETTEKLGPDDERERLKVNGGLPGRARGRRISLGGTLDERPSRSLSLE